MSLEPRLGATYRLQLRREFGFTDAAAVVPYLASLGIETLYLSPITEAVPGSPHGYDGTDPTRLREELGGAERYDALVEACERYGLGICVDHVPNHLATWPGGPWWRQLLAEGPTSTVAAIFDVDWEAGDGKVSLPLLDGRLDTAIADGAVRLGRRDDETVVLVGDVDLPVAAGTEGTDLAEVLSAQHYRLADWHDQTRRNYRRFFDIDGLVGVRVEDPEVFDRTHSLVRDLARNGRLSALRVDHVDGLARPTEYLARLAAATGVPILVEKILSGDERLRSDWPVTGTTGYETIDDVGGVLVDPRGLERLTQAAGLDGDEPVQPLTVATRRLVADASFPAELGRVASRLGAAPSELRDLVTRLPRYRTYLDSGEQPASATSTVAARSALRHELDETAVWRSLRTDPGHAGADELVDLLLEPAHRDVALRVQQLTGALMAKGVEDTAWYRLGGPLAFCEVGGDPGRSRRDALERWHERAAARATSGVHGLVPGTTHDTKRAQDVRSRLYALSEMADPFEAGLRRLRVAIGLDESGGDLAFETRVAAQLALGVLPPTGSGGIDATHDMGGAASGDAMGDAMGEAVGEAVGDAFGDAASRDEDVASRLADALVKGGREAKRRSSWTEPDTAYEARLRELAETLLGDHGAALRSAFGAVVDEVMRLGALNSLSAVVLRHALPGVPDCYEGDETWNLSLVDPDNRRPVDFGRLARGLADMEGPASADGTGFVGDLRRSWRDGRLKLHVTASCLRARRKVGMGALAPDAHYVRLGASGPASGSVLAFARRASSRSGTDTWAVAMVTRLGGRLGAVGDDLPWGPSYEGTVVLFPEDAPSAFSDVITGSRVRVRDGAIEVSEAFSTLPVALLVTSRG